MNTTAIDIGLALDEKGEPWVIFVNEECGDTLWDEVLSQHQVEA